MNNEIKTEILTILKPEQMVYLSTCVNNQPSVRPVTLMYNDAGFFIATGVNDAKVAQIAANPKIEICLLLKSDTNAGYVRARGSLTIITNSDMRKAIYDCHHFLSHYWKESTNPDYVLYQMDWKGVEYMKPGDDLAISIDW
jgi:uncharacterized pyridoxamine 5'-phosphate oxidase family protein